MGELGATAREASVTDEPVEEAGAAVVAMTDAEAARIAQLEAEVMALELTVLRVAGDSRDGRPDPASSILKLRGSQLQQDVYELMVDVAGVDALTWYTGEWGSETLPRYLNYRKASIYSGSNEVQRNIISGGILGLKG